MNENFKFLVEQAEDLLKSMVFSVNQLRERSMELLAFIAGFYLAAYFSVACYTLSSLWMSEQNIDDLLNSRLKKLVLSIAWVLLLGWWFMWLGTLPLIVSFRF